MSPLVLARTADNCEGHTSGKLAETDHALSVDYALPKFVAGLECHPGVSVREQFDDRAVEHECATAISMTVNKLPVTMITWSPGLRGSIPGKFVWSPAAGRSERVNFGMVAAVAEDRDAYPTLQVAPGADQHRILGQLAQQQLTDGS